MKYNVLIKEIIYLEVEIEANSEKNACDKAYELYTGGVLSESNECELEISII